MPRGIEATSGLLSHFIYAIRYDLRCVADIAVTREAVAIMVRAPVLTITINK